MMIRTLPDDVRYRQLDAAQLRASFLLESLFQPGQLQLTAFDVDRAIVGAAVPTNGPLTLDAPPALRASHFTERREVGVINVGGPGRIVVDGRTFPMAARECLYVGRGSKRVVFESDNSASPAAFYLTSFPAHTAYPTTHGRHEDARALRLGTTEQANRRTIWQFIHPEGIRSCQLVMGYTELETGSVWNTMPPHMHERRCEIYMYFDLPADARVLHLMGRPDDTRHLLIGDRQAVVAPSWSLHAGAGTQAYRFVWAMGGENQAFDDMDAVKLSDLR